MTRLPRAFVETDVPLDQTLLAIERLLTAHGVRGQRWTNETPFDETRRGPQGRGRLIYEFAFEGRSVALAVEYHPKDEGTTAPIAARGLLWLLQHRLESVDWGLESFDEAFMAHLTQRTALEALSVADVPPLELPAAEEDEDAADDG